MLSKLHLGTFVLAAGALLASGGLAQARDEGPKPPAPDTVKIGEEDAKRLLVLMDRDKNGKVSKKEFMKFMEAEFNRLDKDKNGELDVQELTESQLTVSRPATFSSVGK